MRESLAKIANRYPGLDIKASGDKEWQVIIPTTVAKTHEQRFSSVMEVYLKYLVAGEIPAWERSHMKAKYYTTTKAVELARK